MIPLGEIAPASASPIYPITPRVAFIKEYSKSKQVSISSILKKHILALIHLNSSGLF